ncbi:hypothetical protein [Microvirga sp. 2TAF3]|uniref:hypothetical protein n=1 Tax=Microvirga sp. 2TAF3 TaxID=3233014 RepID=UPI003F9B3F65
MNFAFAISGRAVFTLCAILAASAVAGCSSGNPTGDLLASSGLAPKTAPRPDFIASTRPQALDYIPIGTPQEGRPTAAKTVDEVKAAEAELDALRAQNQSKGEAAAQLGGTPAPQPVMLPAAKPKPKSP